MVLKQVRFLRAITLFYFNFLKDILCVLLISCILAVCTITDSESIDHIKYNYDVQYKSDYKFFYQREHQIPPPAWVTDSFMYRMTNEWFKYDYGSKFLPRAQARLRGGNCYIWLKYIINIKFLTIV